MLNKIDKKILDILACPECLGDVEQNGEKLVCLKCGLKYPLKNNIPIMLAEEAEM
jgi:uncharacterized protein